MADQTITVKPTSTSLQPLVHSYDANQKVLELKEKVMDHYEAQYHQVKLVFKGRVLNDNSKLADIKVTPGSVIMLVINKKADSPKKTQNLSSSQQTIQKVPGSFETGMGSSMPVGFGGYSLINHPQYMSAMSGAVASQENMEQILNDPTYQGMMEQLLNDPDTLRSMMQENPMFRSMMKDNPQLKWMMDNPEMMKMLLNKDTIKMATEMMKKNKNQESGSNPNMMNPLMGMGGMGIPGLFGQNANQANQNPQGKNSNQPNQYQPNQANFNPFGMNPMGFGMNPFLMNMMGQQQKPQNQQSPQQPQPIEQKYKSQIKELEDMGFKDRQLIIKALIESKGDVDGALQRLCQD